MAYLVTFQWSETIYCVNIAIGTIDAINKHYSKYQWFSLRAATEYDIEEAKRKGMPIVKV